MEKRKRYTYQIKTEVSQSAAYFIDQIVDKSKGYYKSRSDFVRKNLLLKIIEIEPVVEEYLSKSEMKNVLHVRYPRIELIDIPSFDIINSTQHIGNSKRKRYTVQVGTELSKAPYLYVGRICEIYKDYELYSYNSFLRRLVIRSILKHKPLAFKYLSEKERLEYEKYKDFKI